MSKVAIQGNASGTGVFTIASPNSNTDRVITLPDEAGTVLTSASDVAASQITDALNATGSAPIYACRAWVNFNGTGTVAIRASGNVSSITDNGAGDYTVNFATAFSDDDYAGVVSASNEASAYPITRIQDDVSVLSTSCRLVPARNTSGVNIDTPYVSFVVFR